jgi:hypothetical protein
MKFTGILMVGLSLELGILPATALDETTNVNANGTMGHPLWTDTGISLDNGETVAITASGSWCFDDNFPAADTVSANGTHTGGSDLFYNDSQIGQLVAFVGSNPLGPSNSYFALGLGNSTYFPMAAGHGYWPVGTANSITTDRAGELWLGMNDAAQSGSYTDNSGYVTASIHIAEFVDVQFADPSTYSSSVEMVGKQSGVGLSDSDYWNLALPFSDGDCAQPFGLTSALDVTGVGSGISVEAYSTSDCVLETTSSSNSDHLWDGQAVTAGGGDILVTIVDPVSGDVYFWTDTPSTTDTISENGGTPIAFRSPGVHWASSGQTTNTWQIHSSVEPILNGIQIHD